MAKQNNESEHDFWYFIDKTNAFLIKHGLNEFQSSSIIISVIGLPLSWILGFSASDGFLVSKILFFAILLMDLICIIYTILKIKKKKGAKSTSKANFVDMQNQSLDKESVLEKIDQLNPYMFEHFVGMLFEAQGYDVEVTSASRDYGADVIATSKNESLCIQAKLYSNKVSNDAVQQVYSAKDFYSCTKAVIVTNNRLTSSAMVTARTLNVEVYDREKLYTLVEIASKNKIYFKQIVE